MLLAGSVLDQLPGRKYTASLRFFEFAPRMPWPRPATFTRMGHELPSGVEVALRAPREATVGKKGPLRLDDDTRAQRDMVWEAADKLGARALIVPTPADLTPGARSRDLLAAYFEGLPRTADRHIVWAPRGAWEHAEAAAVAAGLDLVCAFDPLQNPAPVGKVAYAQLVALGYQTTFSTATLEDVAERLQDNGCEQTYVSIDSPRSFKQAEQLQQLANAARSV